VHRNDRLDAGGDARCGRSQGAAGTQAQADEPLLKMYRVIVPARNELAPWRDCVRPLLAARISPEDIIWLQAGDADAFLGEAFTPPRILAGVRVSRRFMECAEIALCHADRRRFDLLYRIAFRLQSERKLLTIETDPDIVLLTR